MHRLLLICLFLIAGTTLSLGQTDPGLNTASTFAVLSSTYIENTGITGVTGDVGLAPAGMFLDNGTLMVRGAKNINEPAATAALLDARALHTYYSNAPGRSITSADLKSHVTFPGIYHFDGDVNLDGIAVLNGNKDVNATFVFVIDGDLTTPLPAPPAPGTGLLPEDGAQAKNIFWIVKGKVDLGSSTNFMGTIISEGNISLGAGVSLIGRAISLNGGVDLHSNNIYLPTMIIADLQVKKTALAGEYVIGDEVTYTITAQNAGPNAATGVVVTELLPAGLQFVSFTTAKGTYDTATNKWNIGRLENGEVVTLTIVFRIASSGQIENKVAIEGDNPDPNPTDDEDKFPIEIPVIAANLSVTKVASGGPYTIGGNVTYTIDVKNAGPYTSQVVSLVDALPAELEYVSSTATQGSYNPATSIYTVGDLAKNGTATLTIVAKIKSFGTNGGKITNIAEVKSEVTPETDPTDNKDTEVIQITCPAPVLAIEGESSVCAGTKNLVYTVTDIPGATYTFLLTDGKSGGWGIVSQNRNTVTLNAGTEPGIIRVCVKDICGNCYNIEKTVKVVTPPTLSAISGPASVCANAEKLVYSVTGNAATYNWVVPAGWTIESGLGTASITVTAGTSGGDISVTAGNSCGTSAANILATTITIPPVAPGPIADNSNVCDGLKYSIAPVAGATSYSWAVPSGFTITGGQGTTAITVKATSPNAFGEVTVTASNNTCEGAAATASINIALADGELSFPKAISPNGDGKNDTWIVNNLTKFPTNEVVIFNRWGSEVYRRNNYQNDWAGNGVEQGTYFYKVKVQLCNGIQKEFTGYITIFR
ncbi:ice-binding family protein [Pontibacter vulgaris]|uniref:ice-binding family protein n=1 Tax=Pontibacter vulgaris TaxID=2905679 RepID=UPI001FA7114A|nr:ice-binding family protein [Pontibacter vulgaris]